MNVLLVCVVVVQICGSIQAAPTASADANYNSEEKLNLKAVEEKEVFRLPRALKIGEQVTVMGLMKTDRESFTVSLVAGNGDEPDYANVACQLKMDFPTQASTKDMITVNTVVNGDLKELDENTQSTEFFKDFQFSIKFIIEETSIAAYLKESSTTNVCELENGTEAIKFLTLGGDVQKVETLNFLLV